MSLKRYNTTVKAVVRNWKGYAYAMRKQAQALGRVMPVEDKVEEQVTYLTPFGWSFVDTDPMPKVGHVLEKAL